MDIEDYIRNLKIGEIQAYKNVAVAPLIGDDSSLDHLVLADALKKGFEITEKGTGSVPTLYALNKTGKNVLAIAGEYIVGGKQNRTLERNILFDKDFAGDIPVRCVQHGRWGSEQPNVPERPRMPDDMWRFPIPGVPEVPRQQRPIRRGDDIEFDRMVFRAGGLTPLSVLRGASSQGETWNAVGYLLEDSGVRSSSSDFNEIYRQREEDFEKYRENFKQLDKQIGNLAVLSKNGKNLFVVDLFDRHGILGKHYENLINSYALEAGLKSNKKVEITEQEVREFLWTIDNSKFNSRQPISIGEDYKLSGELEGTAMVYKDNLAYLNLFTREKGNNNRKSEGRDSEDLDDVYTTVSPFSTGFSRMYYMR